MKFVQHFQILLFSLFCLIEYVLNESPTVSVNYLPKKQWKLSKHDLAEIKLDIEREMRSKILQVQMDWENRERMEQAMAYNQFAPVISPPTTFPQSNPVNMPQHQNNFPRFNEQKIEVEESEQILEQSEENDNNAEMNEKNKVIDQAMQDTKKRIQQLRKEIAELKASKKNLNNKINETTFKQKNITVTHTENPKNSEEKTLNDIVNKYSKHRINNEFNMFRRIFKNFNQTNSNNVNIKEVNSRIEESINNIRDDKLFDNFKKYQKNLITNSAHNKQKLIRRGINSKNFKLYK